MSTSPKSRAHDPSHGESSADEITPIISSERFARRRYDTNATSKSALSEGARANTGERREGDAGVVGQGSRTGQVRKNGRGETEGGHGGGDEVEDGKEDGQVWWRDILEKYGSIELDNKGSVARDHLALGISSLSPNLSHLPFTPIKSFRCPNFRLLRPLANANHRTYLSSLAPNLPCLRIHRYRHHTVVPPQYHHCRAGWLKACESTEYISLETGREAAGCDFPGYCHTGASHWRKEVF